MIDSASRERVRKLGRLLEFVQDEVRVHGARAVAEMKNAIELLGADAEFRDLRDAYRANRGGLTPALDLDWR